jgi:hypothetical protein
MIAPLKPKSLTLAVCIFRILELEESTGESKKLTELIKKKDETIKRYEDRYDCILS